MQARVFPKDREFLSKIDGLTQGFAWYLIYHRTNVRGPLGPIHEPPDVVDATRSLQARQDVYLQFEQDCIRESADPTDSVHITRLYSEFKNWFKESYPGQHIPSKAEAKSAFIRIWGNTVSARDQRWVGRKLFVFLPGVEQD